MMNLIAGEEDEYRNDDSSEQVHHRRGDDGGADPAHVLAEKAAGGLAKLGDFEAFHAEGCDHAISDDGFLENLAESAEGGRDNARQEGNLVCACVVMP